MRIYLAAAIVLSACGGGEDKSSLSCEYLAGDNCWKTTATMATSCLPTANERGVLSADNGSCTFASGVVVTFSPALELPLPQQYNWNFSVTKNGAACMTFKDSSRGFELTVNDETVTESLVGSMGLSLSCPDGMTYENSNALDLLKCDDESFGDLPGTTSSSSATSVSFGLISTGGDDLTVFDCAK